MADSFPTVSVPTETSMTHFSASSDPIDWLPPPAAERLRHLRQMRDDARAVLTDSEVVNELRMDKGACERRIAELQRHPQEGGRGVRKDHPALVAEQTKLEKITAELARHHRAR